jgi:hypothetical protein
LPRKCCSDLKADQRYFEKSNQGSLLLFWNGKCNAIISIAIHVLSTGRDRILRRFAAWTGFSLPIFDVMGEGMYEV